MRKTLSYLAAFAVGCSGGSGAQDQNADPTPVVDTTIDGGGQRQDPPSEPVTGDASAPPTTQGVVPAGWLYTENGKMYVSNGSTGTQWVCLLYTSDAADERSSVDLGGR